MKPRTTGSATASAPSSRKQTKRPKTTVKTTAVPTKIVQLHGGALNDGGTPGNVGGTGRPPNQLRDAMRGKLDELLPDLWRKYQTKEIDALELANFLAKYGLGTKDESVMVVEGEEQVKRFAALVHDAIAKYAPEKLAAIVKDVQATYGNTA